MDSKKLDSLVISVKNQIIDLYLSGGIAEKQIINQKVEFIMPVADHDRVYGRFHLDIPDDLNNALVELIRMVRSDCPPSNVIELEDSEASSTGRITLYIPYQTVTVSYTLPNSVELMSHVIKNKF